MLLSAEAASQTRREPIPQEVRRAVFERDGGRCTQCGADFDLQYDHVIPVALGGATRVDNLQLLCGECNRAKGADL
jgi:5-methylcytosine-specific restriction endonuclease McrA